MVLNSIVLAGLVLITAVMAIISELTEEPHLFPDNLGTNSPVRAAA